MIGDRITDPVALDESSIRADVAAGKQVIVQFSSVRRLVVNVLDHLDQLCAELGVGLVVRFFGRYWPNFGAGALLRIPHVESLAIDIDQADGIEILNKLEHLSKLEIRIYELSRPDFLSFATLSRLKKLTIGPSKAKVDLAPLKDYRSLSELELSDQDKNIDRLGQLPSIEHLELTRITKKVDLSFINGMNLRTLSLLLGGRENIDEIDGNRIEALSIHRVRGFSKFDRLRQWKSLRTLFIEDQIQLRSLTFSEGMEKLQHLRILNCKSIDRLENLKSLTALERLRIAGTAIDFETLCGEGLPKSLKKFAFYTLKKKNDDTIERSLKNMGYGGDTTHLDWMPFRYDGTV